MTGSKGTSVGIRVTQAYTVTAVSSFFDCRRRRCRDTPSRHLLNYPRLRCLRCLRVLVGPVFCGQRRNNFSRKKSENMHSNLPSVFTENIIDAVLSTATQQQQVLQ